MLQRLRFFIPLAVAITCLCGLIYLVGQQNYRQNANDPQINIAEDLAASLALGPQPRNGGHINIEESLYPFYIIYDNNGKVIDTTALLNGQAPKLPRGVLDYTRAHGQDRITWQPASNVRIAAVVTRFESSKSAGFVLAGRNLREVEKREDQLTLHVFVAWIVTELLTLVSVLIFLPTYKKK